MKRRVLSVDSLKLVASRSKIVTRTTRSTSKGLSRGNLSSLLREIKSSYFQRVEDQLMQRRTRGLSLAKMMATTLRTTNILGTFLPRASRRWSLRRWTNA